MAKVNTEKMDKVLDQYGQEIAFGKCHKNDYDEYVIKVYIDGEYSEDFTIYANSKEDAESTKTWEIARYATRSADDHKAKKDEIKGYIKGLKSEKAKFMAMINRGEELDPFESTELDQLNGAITAAVFIFGRVFGLEAAKEV